MITKCVKWMSRMIGLLVFAGCGFHAPAAGEVSALEQKDILITILTDLANIDPSASLSRRLGQSLDAVVNWNEAEADGIRRTFTVLSEKLRIIARGGEYVGPGYFDQGAMIQLARSNVCILLPDLSKRLPEIIKHPRDLTLHDYMGTFVREGDDPNLWEYYRTHEVKRNGYYVSYSFAISDSKDMPYDPTRQCLREVGISTKYKR